MAKRNKGRRRAEKGASSVSTGTGTHVLANLLGLAPILYAALLYERDRQFYTMSVQEDGWLEWATFWGLLGAGALFLLAAAGQRRSESKVPWFLVLVGAFCFFVAGEEVSWGQRVLGYRPPAYFLAENFQQELNIHNVWDTDLRKLLAKTTLLAYGLALPLAALVPSLKRLFGRTGIVAPPLALAPVFVGAFWIYHEYPWKYSGEIIELAMALGFLYCALAACWRFAQSPPKPALRLRQVLLGTAGVVALAAAAVGLNRAGIGLRPEFGEQARSELTVMGRDIMERGRPISNCGIHKRVYSWVEKYEADRLNDGAFAKLVESGVPEDRVAYFIDPWNTPYWIRHRCAEGRRRQRVFVYSFGPDRRRQSTEWELGGDDVGVVLYERGL